MFRRAGRTILIDFSAPVDLESSLVTVFDSQWFPSKPEENLNVSKDDGQFEFGPRSWNNSQWLPVAVTDLMTGARSWSNSHWLPVAVTSVLKTIEFSRLAHAAGTTASGCQ